MTKNLQSSRQELDRLLHAKVFGPIINTSVFFQNLAVRITSHPVFDINYTFCYVYINEKKYRAEYHQHNSES